MTRVGKIFQRLAQGQVVKLMDRAQEEFVRLTERLNYLQSRSCFARDSLERFFLQRFGEYANGEKLDLARALKEHSAFIFCRGYHRPSAFREFVSLGFLVLVKPSVSAFYGQSRRV